MDITNIGALTGLLADSLYIFWLYKEDFIKPNKLTNYIENLLEEGLKTATKPAWVKENFQRLILPVWARLEQTRFQIEFQSLDLLKKDAKQKAAIALFGSLENYNKVIFFLERVLEDLAKERPKNPKLWFRENLNTYLLTLSEENFNSKNSPEISKALKKSKK